MRPLLSLMVLLLTLSVSGISSAAMATTTGDDCCAKADADAGTPDQDRPNGDHDACPPLCHKCACSPTFAVPKLVVAEEPVVSPDPASSFDVSSQLPPSPSRPGVFHPPRTA